jgi:hypothetical protein
VIRNPTQGRGDRWQDIGCQLSMAISFQAFCILKASDSAVVANFSQIARTVGDLLEYLVNLARLLAGQVERTGKTTDVRDQLPHEHVSRPAKWQSSSPLPTPSEGWRSNRRPASIRSRHRR